MASMTWFPQIRPYTAAPATCRSGAVRSGQPGRDRRVPRARTQASRSPPSPRRTVPVKMSSRSVEAARSTSATSSSPMDGRLQVLDQDRGDDPRVLVVVGRCGDRGTGHGVEHGPVHGPVRVGVLLLRGEHGRRAPRALARHLDAQERRELVLLRARRRPPRASDPVRSPRGAGPAWARRWPASASG